MIGTLNEVTNMTCFTITTPEDIKVEGAEEIEVQFSFMNRIGSFIARSGDDSATIIISDDDCEFSVWFSKLKMALTILVISTEGVKHVLTDETCRICSKDIRGNELHNPAIK